MRRRATSTEATEDGSEAERGRSGLFSGARAGAYLLWYGGFVSAVLVVGTFAVVVSSLHGVLSSFSPPAAAQPALAAEESALSLPALADRTSCIEIDRSDLRSPQEGLWFQSNCVPVSGSPLLASSTDCNRRALDPADFTEVSPGLHVFRQSWASQGYLWYAGSEGCFDLVSARVVTAVCIDLAVSFEWDANACSAHGGILTWVNGP